jgi:hypothetical protein
VLRVGASPVNFRNISSFSASVVDHHDDTPLRHVALIRYEIFGEKPKWFSLSCPTDGTASMAVEFVVGSNAAVSIPATKTDTEQLLTASSKCGNSAGNRI